MDESKLPPHLRSNAEYLECSECKRKSWGGHGINSPCKMIQPNGINCKGYFQIPKITKIL